MDDKSRFFADDDWTAGVIGLGYVGLPLAAAAAAGGLGVVGFDSDPSKIDRLNAGGSHVDDVTSGEVAALLRGGAKFTTDPGELRRADAVFVCVPSPLSANREPDLSYIAAAADSISEFARPGQLVCLESTTYPGTTREYLVAAVERAGLELDANVWVAYSPERVSPGEGRATGSIPKLVGGVSQASGSVARAAYRRIVSDVHLVSSAEVAEMAKLLENTYRAVNIGLVNEIAQLSHKLGIDVWEVIDAAATKPFGFHAFYPGPGVGGHCIPLDPRYLAWRASLADFPTQFIETAEKINSSMPAYTARRILELAAGSSREPRILVLGVAYKADVSDDRESASVDVVRALEGLGAVVHVHDPVVGESRLAAHGFTVGDIGDLEGYDVVAILTDHSSFDYGAIAAASRRVFDSRGVYRRSGPLPANVVQL